jgi:antitoxin component YwqK of YwqJK toxin-antitoxin module
MGKFEGEYRSCYKNGRLRERGAFRNDQRDGEYEAYDRDGRLREKALYRNGKLVGKFMTLAMEGATAGEMNGVNALSPDGMDGDREDREKAVDDLLKNLQNFNKP